MCRVPQPGGGEEWVSFNDEQVTRVPPSQVRCRAGALLPRATARDKPIARAAAGGRLCAAPCFSASRGPGAACRPPPLRTARPLNPPAILHPCCRRWSASTPTFSSTCAASGRQPCRPPPPRGATTGGPAARRRRAAACRPDAGARQRPDPLVTPAQLPPRCCCCCSFFLHPLACTALSILCLGFLCCFLCAFAVPFPCLPTLLCPQPVLPLLCSPPCTLFCSPPFPVAGLFWTL